VTLKDLLLGEGEPGTDTLAQLRHLVQTRIEEGHGETLFDLGLEDNGKSMNFSKPQWDLALGRLRSAAAELDADCRVLLTRNIGGDVDAGPLHDKDDSATGKLMIRVRSKGDGNVIETRIAVVGNGIVASALGFDDTDECSRCWKEHHAWRTGQGITR
jgi:GTPase